MENVINPDYGLKNLGLNTGNFKSDSDPMKEIYAADGGYEEFANMIHQSRTYDEYIQLAAKSMMNKSGSNKLTKEEREAIEDFTEEQWESMKDFQRENPPEKIAQLRAEALYAERNIEYMKTLQNYRIPYKKIFNGVFPHLDKSKLTIHDKIEYNVDGLPDECWDIYCDLDTGARVTVYYDYATNNENFIEFVKFLSKIKESLKIERMNPKCPLILFDRSLMGIDLDEPLTPEMQRRVIAEEKINPIYHFREAARDLDKATNKHVRFELGIANWTVLWLYCQNFNMYHEAPRQTGKTYMVCHIFAYEFAVGSNDIKMLCAHFNYSEATKNRADMVSKANMFPKFLKIHTLKYSDAKKSKGWNDNTENLKETGGKNIINQWYKNTLKAIATGKTESSGEQAGRGDSSPLIHGDEVNFIKYIQAVLTALNYAHSTARLMAEKANKRACMIFTSTAGTLQTKFGREMYDVIFNQMCMFQLELFGYSYDNLCSYLMANAKKRFFVVKFDYDIMGFSEEWLASRLADAPDSNKFETEILQRWLDVSEKSIFSQAELARIRHRSSNHIEKNYYLYGDYKLVFSPYKADQEFEDMIRSTRHLGIGVDMAEGQGGDSTAMLGINLETGRPLFLFNNNQVYALDMTTILRAFMRDLKKMNPELNIVTIFEVDGPAETLMPALIRDPVMEKCLFKYNNPIDAKKLDYSVKSYARKISDDMEIRYGAIRMRTMRSFLIDILFDLVKNYPQSFDFRGVANEVGTLVRKPSGKIEHDSGFHDDSIFAMLHVYSLLFYPRYREALEKHHNFIVDYRKIQTDPIDQHSVYYEDEGTYIETEGKVECTLIPYWDPEDQTEYEYLKVTQIRNGSRVNLSKEEIVELLKTDLEVRHYYNICKRKPLNITVFGNRIEANKQDKNMLVGQKVTSRFKSSMEIYEKTTGRSKRLF